MKPWTRVSMLVGVVTVLALALVAQASMTPIANSKHNMNNVFGANTIENNEICLPCHAPHNQPDKTMEYLWNHVMPTQSYTLYGDGAEFVGLDEASKMCLSCHDGSVAVDSYGGHLNGTKFLGVTNDANGSTAGYVIGAGGNLKHDHPVGVLYPGLTAGGTWTYTRGFKDPTKFNKNGFDGVQTGTAAGVPVWDAVQTKYVNNTGAVISAVGGNSVRLAKHLETDAVGTVVGCASCHTPHTNTFNFLRIPNTNSQLCLTCHDK